MTIIDILAFSTVLLPVLINSIKLNVRQKKKILALVFILLFGLMIGLRDQSVGTDTQRYVSSFYLFGSDPSYAFSRYNSLFKYEYVYLLFCRLCYIVTPDYHFFLTVCAFISSVSLIVFVTRYCKDFTIGNLTLFIVGYWSFSLSGIRQTLAISFLMWAIPKSRQKKWLQCLIYFLLAFFCHNSSVVFIFALLLIANEPGKLNIKYFYAIPVVGLAMNLFFEAFFRRFVFDILSWNRFDNYSAGIDNTRLNMTMFFIQALILAFCLIVHRNQSKFNRGNQERNEASQDFPFSISFETNVKICLIGMAFQSLVGIEGNLYRLALYYTIFFAPLLSNSLYYTWKNNKLILSLGIVTVFLIYIVTF